MDPLLRDPWETVRGEALVALVTILDRNEMTRSLAHKHIAKFSQETGTPRRYAARALAKLSEFGPSQDVFGRLSQDKDHLVRIEILSAFGALEGERGFERL